MGKTLLSIGHGYVARALADHLRPQGWTIIGTSRSAERAEEVARAGDEAAIWPGADLPSLAERASHILVSVPPDAEGCPAARAVPDGIAPDWVGYLSTTGVYGDTGGAWVDETAPLHPSGPRGAARVRAEAAWRTRDLPLHILRLSGIYGPGRSAFERIAADGARRIIKPGQVFCRIHVDDIVTPLAASMAAPMPGAIWNLADACPAPPQDVLTEAARIAGVRPPPEVSFEEAVLSPMARSFYAANKRVDGRRIHADLGTRLHYEDYRAGLRAIWATRSRA